MPSITKIWPLLKEVHASDAESDWATLDSWRLIPLEGNMLIRVSKRQAVFVLPDAGVCPYLYFVFSPRSML